MLLQLRQCYFYGLRKNGLVQEAQNYLDVVYGPDTRIEGRDADYIIDRSIILRKQHRLIEAEAGYRKSLELLKKAECDILANGPYSNLLYWQTALLACLYGLASTLEHTGRIEEAKTMYRRKLELGCAASGPESVEAQISISNFDDFLVDYGYIEESAALRAEFPCLLHRNKLPPESW